MGGGTGSGCIVWCWWFPSAFLFTLRYMLRLVFVGHEKAYYICLSWTFLFLALGVINSMLDMRAWILALFLAVAGTRTLLSLDSSQSAVDHRLSNSSVVGDHCSSVRRIHGLCCCWDRDTGSLERKTGANVWRFVCVARPLISKTVLHQIIAAANSGSPPRGHGAPNTRFATGNTEKKSTKQSPFVFWNAQSRLRHKPLSPLGREIGTVSRTARVIRHHNPGSNQVKSTG